MSGEVVLDASVAVKCFLTEPGSDEARDLARSGARLIAPDFVYAEIASVTVKRTRRGDIDRQFAEEVVEAAPGLFDETFLVKGFDGEAQRLAFDRGISVYDALYVALAERRDAVLATADKRLVARLTESRSEVRCRMIG